MSLGLGRRGLVVDRSHRRRVVERVAELDPLRDRVGQLRQVLVLHVLVDEEPFARRAALPGVEERGDQGGLDRLVEVAVLADHQRAVAAHLEQELLPRGPLGDRVTGRDRTDEADGLGSGVRGDLVADDGAGSGHQVHDPRRQVGGLDALGEPNRADRGRGRRSPHHGVPVGDRRSQDLPRHRVGPVPGADDRDDAPRHALEQHALVRVDRGREQPLGTDGVRRRHVEVGDQLLDLVERLGLLRLALIEGEGVREVLRRASIASATRLMAAARSNAERPAHPGHAACAAEIARCASARVALGDGADHLAGGRARRVEGRAALGVDPRAADPHPHVFAHCLHAIPERWGRPPRAAPRVDLERSIRPPAARPARRPGSRPPIPARPPRAPRLPGSRARRCSGLPPSTRSSRGTRTPRGPCPRARR